MLSGADGDDMLNGGRGNDLIYGANGDDELNGGWDDDQIQGGKGNDILRGGHGINRLFGQEGQDLLDDVFENDQVVKELPIGLNLPPIPTLVAHPDSSYVNT